MTPFPTAIAQKPRVVSQPSEVSCLLGEAAKVKGLILSRRELCGFEQVSLSELRSVLRDFGQHDEQCGGKASREILGTDQAGDLGDSPAWMDAGSLYEDLISTLETREPVDFVFCLDPWAAQLLIQSGDLAFGAQWILISNLERRRAKSHPEYWEQMDQWFSASAFSTIIPQDAWDQAIGAPEEDSSIDQGDRIHLERPGAWQWRRISGSPTAKPPKEGTLLFLVKYSGSLLHLRVFLDSMARQDFPKDTLHCAILGGEGGGAIETYLKWFALSHSQLSIALVDTSAGAGEEWKPELNRLLKQVPGAVLVLTGDHSILPARFSRVAVEMSKAKARPMLFGVPLSIEATAHIITGNLDPLSNYENMLRAFSGNTNEPLSESVRIVSPETWMESDEDSSSRILEIAQATGSTVSDPSQGLGVLQLGDLP
jgi:hypothetical protein